ELHGLENGAFTRIFEVKNVTEPVQLLLAPRDTDIGLFEQGANPGANRGRGHWMLHIRRPGLYKVSIPNRKVCAPEPIEPLTKGGGARYTDPVVTKGVLGREPGAY